MDDLSLQRLAHNQTLFREVNERITEHKQPYVTFRELICECSDPGCTQSLAVAPGEYEAVRSHPKLFLVARGHEVDEVERVLEDNGRFLTVEKTVEIEFMEETDPRSSSEEATQA